MIIFKMCIRKRFGNNNLKNKTFARRAQKVGSSLTKIVQYGIGKYGNNVDAEILQLHSSILRNIKSVTS